MTTEELARKIKRLLEPTEEDAEWRGVSSSAVIRDAVALCDSVIAESDSFAAFNAHNTGQGVKNGFHQRTD